MTDIKKGCSTCALGSDVCMGSAKRLDNGENTYGMPIDEAEKMFPNGCEDWELSFSTFQDNMI